MAKETIASKIYTILKSKNFKNLETFDENDQPTDEPRAINKLVFCFITNEGKDLGPAVITLGKNDKDGTTVNLSYDAELAKRSGNIDFREFIKIFGNELFNMGVALSDFTHGQIAPDMPARRKTSFKPMFESQFGEMGGSVRTSVQPLEKIKLIIKHSDRVDPKARAARSRKIEKIYLANSQGERFLLPFNSLLAARAMARHVSNGGTPYDKIGEEICKYVDELVELHKFCRKMKHTEAEDPKMHELFDTVKERYCEIRKTLSSLNSQGGYSKKSEQLTGDPELEFNDTVPTGYEHVHNMDETLKGAMPYVWRAHNKKTKTLSSSRDFRVGDTVVVDANETEWHGMTGKILSINASNAKVKLDNNAGTEDFQLGELYKENNTMTDLKEFSEFSNWVTSLGKDNLSSASKVGNGHRINRRSVNEGTPFGGQSTSDICPKCKQKIKDNDLTTAEGFGGMEAHIHCPYKSSDVKEGVADFFVGSSNERAVSKLSKQFGFNNLKKQVGNYTAVILTDSKFENFIVRLSKDGKPVDRIPATGLEELKPVLEKVNGMMAESKLNRKDRNTVQEGYEASPQSLETLIAKAKEELKKLDGNISPELARKVKELNKLAKLKESLDDQDAEKPPMYCDKCGGYHDGQCPDEEGLDAILEQYPEAFHAFLDGGEIDNDPAFFEALYVYYSNTGQMPYGVQKARTGDPYQWIANRLNQQFGQIENFDDHTSVLESICKINTILDKK